jgi:hypothetical protein
VLYFEDDEEREFELDLRKGKNKTIIYGDGWEQYIVVNNFKGGELVAFSLIGEVNRLRTLYVQSDDDDDDQDDIVSQDDQDDIDSQDEDEDIQDEDEDNLDEEEDIEDEDDGPILSAIFSQRMKKLTRDDKASVKEMLPSSSAFLGKPFVHRLTKTNMVKKVMVRCFIFFHLFLVITKYGEMSNILCSLFSLNDGVFRSYL